MRIAFVSDVHGNLHALEAVLMDLQVAGPFDRIVGGGDYTVGGAFPKESLNRVRNLGWDYVRGNADEETVEQATGGRIPVHNRPAGMELDAQTIETVNWGVARLSPDDIAFLSGLEIQWTIEGPSGQRLVYVHATPDSTWPGYPPDVDESVFLPMFEQTGADVLLHGHIHHAYLRDVSAGRLGCVGSVGLPFDGDPRPCYLVAEDSGSGWTLEHRRVSYNNQRYADALLASGTPYPDAPARRVLTGVP